MGKRKNGHSLNDTKGQTRAEETIPSSTNQEAVLPIFNDDALSKLTDNIDKKLQESQNKPKKSSKKGRKVEQIDDPVHSKSYDESTSQRGKKRNSKGEVKSQALKRSSEKNDERKKESNGREAEDDSELEKEVLALGGTREDYDLINGVDSASELEDDDIVAGKNLKHDLIDFLNELNIPKDIQDESSSEGEPLETEPPESTEKKQSKEAILKDVKPKSKHQVFDEEGNATVKEVQEPSSRARSGISRGLILDPRPDWYAYELSSIDDASDAVPVLPSNLLESISQHAWSLLEKENDAFFSTQNSASSAHQFYSTIMTSGTLSDKISALTLAVQESPIHNVKTLENLINLAKKRSRDQAIDVLRALKDLLAQGMLLPSNRKLRTFATQRGLASAFKKEDYDWLPGNSLPSGLTDKHLIIWAYEDWLKKQYFEILKILETWCNDEIEFARLQAINCIYDLFVNKPEQEANLLRLLVNKLGDPSKKVASRTSYLILQVENTHPVMKPIIISAIEEQLLFKAGQTAHAKYYAAITLNQTVLSSKEETVAQQLLKIYFALFVALLKPVHQAQTMKKGSQDKSRDKGQKSKPNSVKNPNTSDAQDEEWREKMIATLLSGVNRAYPYMSSTSDDLKQHMDTLYKITHSSNFNTSIQALMLIQQLTASNQISSDRYYRTLYESLLDPRLLNSSKQAMYLNLLHRSLKADLNASRVKAFIKRILQVLTLHQPSFICGAFFLIRDLEKSISGISDFIDQKQEYESDDEEVFHDVPEDGEQAAETSVEPTPNKPAKVNVYDPRKRDPEHSNADRSSLWELVPFISHYHPSVSVSAAQLLQHKPMLGKPDLSLHTLIHFLDRFVYRNMKSNAKASHGTSIMQPLAAGDSSGTLISTSLSSKTQVPVNMQWFRDLKAEDVKAEDAFFHDYFRRLGKVKVPKEKEEKKGKEEEEEDEEENEEEEIWKALVDSRPEIDADQDDLDMDDLDSYYSDDNDEDEVMKDLDEKSSEEGEGESGEDVQEEAGVDLDDEDEAAFIDSDAELPSDIEKALDVESEEEAPKKEKASRKRRKLKHLPMFASVEDYSALLANEPDGNES